MGFDFDLGNVLTGRDGEFNFDKPVAADFEGPLDFIRDGLFVTALLPGSVRNARLWTERVSSSCSVVRMLSSLVTSCGFRPLLLVIVGSEPCLSYPGCVMC